MAVYKGNLGTVKVGTNNIANITGFNLNESDALIETSTLNSVYATHTDGLKSFDGNVDCHADQLDTDGQLALIAGAEVTLNLYPYGSSSGARYATGNVIVNGITTANPDNSSLVSVAFTFQGTGPLTWGTVS